MPLRPIISSRGSVTYETAKELARIQKPLVGRSLHHVQNTRDFISSLEGIQLKPNECIMSYDGNALFTSIPIQPAINIIKKHLEEDKELHLRTSMTEAHLMSAWVLSSEYIFLIPKQVLSANPGCCYGFNNKSHSSQLIYGGSGGPSHQYFTNSPSPVEEICGWYFYHHQESQ